jgi:2-haloalkanoic acid dehalogenase type II
LDSIDITQFEAVIFDLDSTLIDTQQYPIVASEWLLHRLGVSSETEMMTYIRSLVERYRQAIRAIVNGAPYRSPFNIIQTAMENSLSELNVEADLELFEAATQRFKTLHVDLSIAHDKVEELLESLREKSQRLGIITNSFEGNAQIILRKLNLFNYFSKILDCGSVQTYKPSRIIFERAVHDLDVDLSKTIYVGDEFYADMFGAKSVGMTTIWINKRDRSLSDQTTKHGVEYTPDFVLRSVSEMCDLLCRFLQSDWFLTE